MGEQQDDSQPGEFVRYEYREIKSITEQEFLDALSSGDVERIHYALIDGSRCLDETFVFPHAYKLCTHSSRDIRWGALFAVEQSLYRADDFAWSREFCDQIASIATTDPDEDVRHVAFNCLDYAGRLAQEVIESAARRFDDSHASRIAIDILLANIDTLRSAMKRFGLGRENPTVINTYGEVIVPADPALPPTSTREARDFVTAMNTLDARKMSLAFVQYRFLEAEHVVYYGLKALSHSNERLRWSAMLAIARAADRLGDRGFSTDVLDTLTRLAAQDSDNRVRRLAAAALLRLFEISARPARTILESNDDADTRLKSLHAVRAAIDSTRLAMTPLKT